MMFAAYVVICVALTPIQECNNDPENKALIASVRVPGTSGLAHCIFRGMAYVADNGLSQPGDVVKVYCRSSGAPGNVG